MRVYSTVFICLLAAGCSRDPIVAAMAGDWSGSAIAGGVPAVVSASFTYDEEAETYAFDGSVTLDGWTYGVWTAASDRDLATVELFHDLGARKLDLTDVLVDDRGDTRSMEGSFTVDTCYENRAPLDDQDPAACRQSGTFTMSEGALPTASDAVSP